MGKQRNRTRTNSSVEQLPTDLKLEVDCMLGDYRNTYDSICKYIKEYPGHPCAGMPRRAKLHLTD